MKFLLPMIMAGLFFSNFANAYKADPFKGWYKVLSKTNSEVSIRADDPQYMLIDVDTLGGIWAKYADGPLPPDLEPYREEPTILAAFTDRETVFLTFEKNAMIANGYLAIQGSGTNMMELGLRGDNNYNLGVRDNDVVSRYLLAAPTPRPSALKAKLKSQK